MTLRNHIETLLRQGLADAQRDGLLPTTPVEELIIERPQNPDHGDFACSVPLKLAKPMRTRPMAIAEVLVSQVPPDGAVEKVWAAPPGFVNFSLDRSWLARQVDSIRGAGPDYGNTDIGAGQRVQVEFVSVNPTGPLHVGHARGAVIGSALANILDAAGYEVEREYYLNDAGTQMDMFNQSLFARYQQLFDRDAQVPEDGYQGEYMIDLAQELKSKEGDRFLGAPETEAVRELGELAMEMVVKAIKQDLERLRVSFDVWFSERTLYTDKQYEMAIELLRDRGFLTERDGAVWFVGTALGEEQDTVLVRRTGAPTYFASDVAYHYSKFVERRFDRVVNVWGADHQGHVSRMKAVMGALGIPPERLTLMISQMVSLKRDGEVVRASKRSGDIVTLKELVDEVGPDACRYFFLARSPESQMEFDLALAKKQSSENPVYYVQYAHARITGILELASEKGIDFQEGDLSLLVHEAELALVRKLLVLPDLVETMARNLEPHHLPHFAHELATAFHWFYEKCRVVSGVSGEEEITKARLKLAEAAKVGLARCLDLMSMDAPQRM